MALSKELERLVFGELGSNTKVKNLPYLKHYGIKGQRWGIRRKKESSNSGESNQNSRGDSSSQKPVKSASDPKKQVNDVQALKKYARAHGTDKLTNEQLQAVLNRTDLEARFQKWASKNPTLKQQAQNFIVEEVKKESTKVLLEALTGKPQPKEGSKFIAATVEGLNQVSRAKGKPAPRHKR